MSYLKEMTDEELEEQIECYQTEIDDYETEIIIYQEKLDESERELKKLEIEKQRRGN